MSKQPDLPRIVRPLDGRWCEVPMESIEGLRSTVLGLTASPVAAAGLECKTKQALDRRLDLALEETFPASDPISVICD